MNDQPGTPRLSVIVTSYNIEDYLPACLDSIVGQTLTDLEIIVVDDGSSDRSPEIIREYAERDPRIVPVLLADNSIGGVATAANAGLDRATADYVGFADGDDLYEPEMFEALLAAAEEHDTDLAMCQYLLLDDADGSSEPPADAHRWDTVAGLVHQLDMHTRKQFLPFIAVPWRKLYRRSMLEEHRLRFPVGDYFYEDNPFHWFTLLTARSIALVPEVLCHHRVARVGQTMATVDERLFKIFQHHDTILAWLVDNELEEQYRATLLGWAMSQMEWISRRTPQELRRELYDILRHVYAQHDDDTVERALREGAKGRRAHALSKAIQADNFATYNRILDHDDGDGGPLSSALYHLRYSGVGATAKLTGRYASNQLVRGGRKAKRLGKKVSDHLAGGDADLSGRDLMFALLVMERRLQAIEEQLGTLNDELSRRDEPRSRDTTRDG